MHKNTITLDTGNGPVEVPRASAREWTMTFDTPDGPVEVPLTEELWDAYASDERSDAIRRAVRDDPRWAEIELGIAAAYDRLHALAGDHERQMTRALVLDMLHARAADDMMLAWDLRVEEGRIWELCGEQTEIEVAIGDAMDTASA